MLPATNHKMGQRGTTNTLLNFGEGIHSPAGRLGAVGYLVGEPNRGLALAFHMMNVEANALRVGMGQTSPDTPAICTHCSTRRSVRRAPGA